MTSETLAAGSVLGSYRIIRLLGEGGMGCVYEAEHVGLKVRRALKVFSTESEHGDFLRKRFVAEGRILADLQHPRIVRVYDFAVDEATGTPYFAMDLVVSPTGEPQTLEQACRDGVDEEQVAGWFRDICEGLGYIHGKGIVHRDISLDNILIDPEGRAVLTDFGIAKITGESYRRKIDVTVTMVLSGEKLRMGKGLYMAPELKSGAPATMASDAYAVGVIVFRLLAGAWYTPHARLEDALAGLECYDWSACLKGLLAKDPAQRVSLDEAVAALAPFRRRGQILNRVRVLVALMAIVVAGVVGGVAWLGVFDRDDANGEVAPELDSDDEDVIHVELNPNIVKKPVDKRLRAIDRLKNVLDEDGLLPDKDRVDALEGLVLLLPDKDDRVRDAAFEAVDSALLWFADTVLAVKTAVRIVKAHPNEDFAKTFKEYCSQEMGISSEDFTIEAAEKWCADELAKRALSSSEDEPSNESE